jgi:hypothetical protein
MKKYKLVNDKNMIDGYINNQHWPPKVGSYINVSVNQYKKIAQVKKVDFEKKHCYTHIINHTTDNNYLTKDNTQKVYNSKGIFLLRPHHEWSYTDEDKLYEILDVNNSKNQINKNIETGYKNFINNLKKENMYNQCGSSKNSKKKLKTNDSFFHDGIKGTIHTGYSKNMSGDEGFKDTYILSQDKPDLNKLFQEKRMDVEFDLKITDKDNFYKLKSKKKKDLLEIVNNSHNVSDSDKIFVVNENVTVHNIIKHERHLSREALEIEKWIVNKFDNKKFGLEGLNFEMDEYYLNIRREHKKSTDDITEALLCKALIYFDWQIGKPIQYDTLKYVLFHNSFQKTLKQDMEQQKEAELIFSQEYIIALQPQPIYQLFCIKRLIQVWYGDEELEKNIRKIKVLINQFRCKNNEPFNREHGVLPSIVIYPRYGYKIARVVIERLSLYFTHYTTLGWQNSDPHYFSKRDALMYWTNGAINLKKYYRYAQKNSTKSLSNTSFIDNFTRVKNSTNIFSEAIPKIKKIDKKN